MHAAIIPRRFVAHPLTDGIETKDAAIGMATDGNTPSAKRYPSRSYQDVIFSVGQARASFNQNRRKLTFTGMIQVVIYPPQNVDGFYDSTACQQWINVPKQIA